MLENMVFGLYAGNNLSGGSGNTDDIEGRRKLYK